MENKQPTIAIAWCDNGTTDGNFTEGILYTSIEIKKYGLEFNSAMRVQGNQISRQRQVIFDKWADEIKTDWLLWVDSDIYITGDIFKKIWDAADEKNRPVVSGVYFIADGGLLSMPKPLPVIYRDVSEYRLEHVHPMPHDQLIEIDCAGMGFVLMHKSIIPKLRKKYVNKSMFNINDGLSDKFIGEDISFFRKLKSVNIPVYAHTGAIAKHIKRFSLDENYYGFFYDEKISPNMTLKK